MKEDKIDGSAGIVLVVLLALFIIICLCVMAGGAGLLRGARKVNADTLTVNAIYEDIWAGTVKDEDL